MPERYTPEELSKYRQMIKREPVSRARAEAKRKRKLDQLFDRLFKKTTNHS